MLFIILFLIAVGGRWGTKRVCYPRILYNVTDGTANAPSVRRSRRTAVTLHWTARLRCGANEKTNRTRVTVGTRDVTAVMDCEKDDIFHIKKIYIYICVLMTCPLCRLCRLCREFVLIFSTLSAFFHVHNEISSNT